jgi:hypothetical protein
VGIEPTTPAFPWQPRHGIRKITEAAGVNVIDGHIEGREIA